MEQFNILLKFYEGNVVSLRLPVSTTAYEFMNFLLDKFPTLREIREDHTFPYLIQSETEIISSSLNRRKKMSDLVTEGEELTMSDKIVSGIMYNGFLKGNLRPIGDDRSPSPSPRRRGRGSGSPSPSPRVRGEDKEDYPITITESIGFKITPPMKVDYNFKTSKCFDLIMLDEEAANDYLEADREDNVIILNLPESVALCFTKSGIKTLLGDEEARFIECPGPLLNSIGDKGQRWIREGQPIYVRIPVNPKTGTNAYIPEKNIIEALRSKERVYCLVPLMLGDRSGTQASLSHTITEDVRKGGDYVSSNHCQRGTNIVLSKFVRCNFEGDVLRRRTICPEGMLWNPETKRCIKDTPANRRRLGRNARR